jgi:hypothetical protein
MWANIWLGHRRQLQRLLSGLMIRRNSMQTDFTCECAVIITGTKEQSQTDAMYKLKLTYYPRMGL